LALSAPLGEPPLTPGAKLSSGALITASYRCLRPRAYLLMFAVDAQDEVHWLYPAYLDARSDPESLLLMRQETETALAESPVLDVPVGPARVIAVVTSSPLHVSDIERAPIKTLTAAQLITRWPTASIREWPLTVVAPAAADRGLP
jgi:hypothetical protein